MEILTRRDRWRARLSHRLRGDIDRREALIGRTVRGLSGVEIGALDRPVVRSAETDVVYVDYLDRDGLRAAYRNDPNVNIDQIVDAKAWRTENLADVVSERQFDFVIASHVAEHVPDLIWWLEQVRRILKPNGTLRLALPDRRFTYDYLRHESTFADLLDAYLRKSRAPLPRMIIDDCLSHVALNNMVAWSGKFDAFALAHAETTESAIRRGAAALTGAHDDVHCWVFTARSFLSLFQQAALADFVHFKCERFFEPAYGWIEFIVWLSPCDNKDVSVASWAAAKRSLEGPLIARWRY